MVNTHNFSSEYFQPVLHWIPGHRPHRCGRLTTCQCLPLSTLPSGVSVSSCIPQDARGQQLGTSQGRTQAEARERSGPSPRPQLHKDLPPGSLLTLRPSSSQVAQGQLKDRLPWSHRDWQHAQHIEARQRASGRSARSLGSSKTLSTVRASSGVSVILDQIMGNQIKLPWACVLCHSLYSGALLLGSLRSQHGIQIA